MALTVAPLHETFGAEVSGVDLTRVLPHRVERQLIEAVDHFGVCVFRNTGLDDDSHIRFSRIFGYLELGPAIPSAADKSASPRRELFRAGNIGSDGAIVQDELAIKHKLGDRLWHTDSSFMPIRSAYSLLLAHEVPATGGTTWFADTRTAYNDLSASMKSSINGLQVVHSLWWSRYLAGFPIDEAEIDRRPSAVQPLVLAHEPSGRTALYVAAHARDIVGMPSSDGRALIAELLAHASQPKYILEIGWNVGDLVIWDNRITMHRGGSYDHRHDRRDLRRTTIRDGEAPTEPDDPFGDFFAAAQTAPAQV